MLPGRDSDIRAGFDVLCEQLGLRYQVLAEVVQDELRSGKLQEYCVVPPRLKTLLRRSEAQELGST